MGAHIPGPGLIVDSGDIYRMGGGAGEAPAPAPAQPRVPQAKLPGRKIARTLQLAKPGAQTRT
eukprot:scaffold27778_cov157-Isochrysis_galbana.AAC.2